MTFEHLAIGTFSGIKVIVAHGDIADHALSQ